jgi:hypothetical protein
MTGPSPYSWGTPYWPMVGPPVEPPRPVAAMVLATLGGIFIILGGIAELFVGTAISSAFYGNFGGILIVSGFVGVAAGGTVLGLGILTYTHPEQHTVYGVLILVFSVVSLFSFFGGFFLGFVLGLVGGILAIVHNPAPVAWPAPYMMAPPVQRVCIRCGRVVDVNHKFCPHCGNPLG